MENKKIKEKINKIIESLDDLEYCGLVDAVKGRSWEKTAEVIKEILLDMLIKWENYKKDKNVEDINDAIIELFAVEWADIEIEKYVYTFDILNWYCLSRNRITYANNSMREVFTHKIDVEECLRLGIYNFMVGVAIRVLKKYEEVEKEEE